MENTIVAEPTQRRGRGRGRRGRRGGRVREQAGGKAGPALEGRGEARVEEGAGRGVKRSGQEDTAENEFERVLLPDPPLRKYSRKDSLRQKCRLVPCTTAVPPSPELMPCQIKQELDTPGSFDQSPDPLRVVASYLKQECMTDLMARSPSSAHSRASCSASLSESTAPTSTPTDPKVAGNLLAHKDSAPQLQQSASLAPAPAPTPASSSAPPPNFTLQAALASNDARTDDEFLELLCDSEDANAASDIDVIVANCGISDAEPAHLPEHLNTDLIELIETEDIGNDRLLTELLADTDNVTFNWTNDSESFLGQRENFVGPSGPTFSLKTTDRPLDVFLKYFDTDLLDLLVLETNRNIQSFSTQTFAQHSRFHGLKETSRTEIAIFLAMLILQGNLPLPVEKEYFHENGFLTLKYFKTLMPYSRFLSMKKFLHFADDTELTNDDDKLRKLEPLLDILCSKFKELYLPTRDIAIDESLLKWHGRLGFAQKIASKTAKVGIKTYELCESSSGYCWSFFVYTGKGHTQGQTDRQHTDSTDETGTREICRQIELNEKVVTPTNLTAQIVLDLVRPLFNRGHALAMDNFCNSPLLARYLKRNGVDCFGTLRTTREFVPEAIKFMSKTALQPGEVVQSYCHDLSVTMWRDDNLVALLSTFHGVEVSGKEKYTHNKYKPQVVLDYDLSMGGVDKKDQLLSAHPIERVRNRDWYKKVFRRLLNITILNAYIVYKTQNPRMTQRDFRSTLAEEMIATFRGDISGAIRNSTIGQIDDHIVREIMFFNRRKIRRPVLQGNHFLGPGRSRNATCVLCRKSRTSLICKQCGVPLCLKICFEAFHTAP